MPFNIKKSHLIFLLEKYACPFWKQILIMIVFAFISNFFTTLQPLVISGVINVILGNKIETNISSQNSDIQTNQYKLFDLNHIGSCVNGIIGKILTDQSSSILMPLIILSTFFLLCSFISEFIYYLSEVFSRWIRIQSSRLIRIDLLRHLLYLGINFYHKQKTGELISRITQDATNTAHGLGPLVRSVIHNSIQIIMYSIYLFSTSLWLSIFSICLIFSQFGINRILKRPVRITVRNTFDHTANFATTLQETISSIRVVKSFSAEDFQLRHLKHDIKQLNTADFKEGIVRLAEKPARSFLDSFAIIGILFIATIELMRGGLNVQGFLLFIFVGRLLINPINNFAVNFTWMQSLLASYERLNELFSEKPNVMDGEVNKEDFHNAIELKHVFFSFSNEFSLKNISLTIEKGEVIAFVGISGAGKSTLTDLILRFYDPIEGEILIDGVNLRKVRIAAYRQLFGVVPQESLLFHDTVINNISYGREKISLGDIVRAAKIANVHDFIMELPQGYDTIVGDRGVRLSGGQRQRIAIARAIVSNPQILIFDEATSSLDTESEKQVQMAIDHILKRTTAIIIAHRLSTILHADKIVVLDKGQIEAVGKHEELLLNSSIYRNLYELQFEANRKEIF